MEITTEQAKAIRRKQADKMLTQQKASEEVGINPVTFKKLITGGNVKNTVYEKAMRWLAKDY
ncbi:repressor [Streptococcus parauberis]|uniref:Uncharacterized protein n=1 Tax=Streptococcus parauberis TaxID=1348 RepID=A0A1S1ZRK9_9STRE|nr:hypothetical protein [Streptococcus parauberis]QBX10122.1 hypothetical protein JavanS410_0021 [Streptococcus satellite phage Javan410]MDT2749110.1 hypothetical protein [Streptococcus parauberis]OHY30866.1 repressor [Streptococcus parauberis]PCH13650.1 hypothetical protein A9Y57_00283 [Streptococcus parauberis]PIA83743.1 hypothetical protein ADO07_01612 [Streptococcus parauberis]